MKTIYKEIALTFTLLIMTMMGSPLFAQTTSGGGVNQDTLLMIVLGLVLVVAILVLIVAIYMVTVLKTILKKEEVQKAEKAGVELKPEKSLWKSIDEKLTGAVPIEREEDVMLDHDYDGIKELDNHLPPWWKALFYFTIIVGVIYLFGYHVIDIFPLQEEEYATQLAEAEAQLASLEESGAVEIIDVDNPVQSEKSDVIASGKSVFAINCASCHADDGGGKPQLGPNLTDNYWLHGGDFKSVFKTIHNGVPGTNMLEWGQLLSPVQIRDVASYVMTLRGTTPANPKEPEGELYEPETASSDSTPADSVQTN